MSSGNGNRFTPFIVQMSPEQNVPDVRITTPVKMDRRYISYISVDRKPFYIQSQLLKNPSISVNSDTKLYQIRTAVSEIVGDYVRLLEEKIQQYTSLKSKEFFNGHYFSIEQIKNRYKSSVKYDNDDNQIWNLELANNVQIKDQYGTDYQLSDILELPISQCVPLVAVKNVLFTATSIHTPFVIEQMKIYVDTHLSEWNIENDAFDKFFTECDIVKQDNDEEKKQQDQEQQQHKEEEEQEHQQVVKEEVHVKDNDDVIVVVDENDANTEKRQEEESNIQQIENPLKFTRYCTCICPLHPPSDYHEVPKEQQQDLDNEDEKIDSEICLSDLHIIPTSQNTFKKNTEIPLVDECPNLEIESLSVQKL